MSTVTNADGSVSVTNADGSITTTATDGTVTTAPAPGVFGQAFNFVGDYADAVLANPLQHIMSMFGGAVIMRAVDTRAIKGAVSNAEYAKIKDKLILGSLPLINAE